MAEEQIFNCPGGALGVFIGWSYSSIKQKTKVYYFYTSNYNSAISCFKDVAFIIFPQKEQNDFNAISRPEAIKKIKEKPEHNLDPELVEVFLSNAGLV